MKRLISALIIVLLVASCCCALAEIPDVSKLTDTELMQLNAAVMQEISTRKALPSFTAPIGVYEAGKDFPVGKYVISSPNYCTYITIYANMASYTSGKPLERKVTLYGSSNETKVVDFQQGMVVFVDFSNARFEPFGGLRFE